MYRTEASATKESFRQYTSTVPDQKPIKNPSINQRFKEYLLSSNAKRRSIRPQSVDRNYQSQTTQQNKQTENSTILSKLYAFKENKGQSSASCKQKMDKDQKRVFDPNSSVCDQTQRNKKKQMDINHSTQIQQSKQQAIKSFDSFLEARKISTHRQNGQKKEDSFSFTMRDKPEEARLSISGNHKEIKKKMNFKNKQSKVASVRKVKPAVSSQWAQPPLKQRVSIQKKNSKVQKVKEVGESQQETTRKQRYPTYSSYCVKNVFSNFNGIQIKYLSIQNNNKELYPHIKRINLKEPLYTHRPTFKKKIDKDIDSRAIVYRSKSSQKPLDHQPIEGWNISSDFNQDIFGLTPNL